MNTQAKLTPRNTDLIKDAVPPTPLHIMTKPNMGDDDKKEPEKKSPLKIAIVGTAPSSRSLAPFNDPSWTIWVCSPGNMNVVPRVDAWFEIHSNLLWPECRSYGEPYVEWLKKQQFPIYMQNQNLVPNAISYPINEMVGKFGKYFFTSSFAYMMAMAIDQGAQEISLYGVDMASKDEYILQRPGGHFFIQEAIRRGIKVSLPMESDLAQPPPLYGYADSTPFGRKMAVREQELKGRVADMERQKAELEHGITYLKGALEDIDYIRALWSGVQV